MKYEVRKYYKAKYSDKYYMITYTLHRDKKDYTIYCYKHMTLYEDIGFFTTRSLEYARTIMHRLINAGPEEKLRFSLDGQLVDLNLMEVTSNE